MFKRPARILAITLGALMLVVESAYATRFDSRLIINRAAPENGPMVRLPGNVLPALKEARLVKSAPNAGRQPITLTLVLKRDRQRGFERYLHEVYDKHSPHYHHFLTQAQIVSRFGPSQKSYDGVLAYLERHGFKLEQGSKNRMTITVRGTRAEAERTFQVRLAEYRIGKKTFYANDRNPALPQQIASNVESVGGLSSLAKPRVTSVILGVLGFVAAIAIIGGLAYLLFSAINAAVKKIADKLASAQKALNSMGAKPIDPINSARCSWENLDGSGQTIGIVAFDSFKPSDVSDFLSLMGFPSTLINNVSKVDINGGTTPGPEQNEVLLDIDTILAVAPAAKVVVYDAPFAGAGASFQPVLNRMINDGVSIITNSFAYCEDETTKADVESIDSLFQQAALAGISVFNATGDTGTTCLDGSQNTVSVPADSPNATAVGGTSLTQGPGLTYGSETWWNGLNETPTSGQGGYGVSKFFPVPSYQTGFASGGRSVPDVSINADPAHGTWICQANGGGCPTGLLNGGTSGGAPMWAALQALLNQSVGQNLGFVNPIYYGFANTSGFHNAASMNSTFAQVGLGSPNLDALHLLICGQTAGAPDATLSQVQTLVGRLPISGLPIPADGTPKGGVRVTLRDAQGNFVGNQTVTLTANAGSNAVITPSSGKTGPNGEAVVFSVSDTVPETVTFTATVNGMTLDQKPTLTFVVPSATSAEISPTTPQSDPADGSTAATITVTLETTVNGNLVPAPGKLVTLSQNGGQSVITAPDPSVTDTNGQISFEVTDAKTENVTYNATDVADGNLPVPGTSTVDFTSGTGCAGGTPPAAPGYAVHTFAQGFVARDFSWGNISVGDCPGADGMAFDSSGNLYVADMPTGNIYKFGPTGGIADSSTLLTPTALGPGLTGLAFDKNGNLFATRIATTASDYTTGGVIQVDPNSGALVGTVATGIPCAYSVKTDPLSGDLFVTDTCNGGASSPDIWRISNAATSPSVSVYTSTTGGNCELAFAPDGTMYVPTNGQVTQISGTNGPIPPTVSTVPNAAAFNCGLAVGGMQSASDPSPGDSQFLLFSVEGSPGSTTDTKIQTFDLTAPAPGPGVALTAPTLNGQGGYAQDKKIIGPDGCLYVAEGNAVYKITNLNGTCTFGPTAQPPAISLTPTAVSPNPAQGSSQSFTATLHYTTPLAGVPVTMLASGANTRVLLANTDSSGKAAFSYTGIHAGVDNVIASATVGGAAVASNPARVTWAAGKDVTFLTLNGSPKGGTPGQPVTVVANLTDVSQNPVAAVSGQTVNFALGSASCSGVTDSNGNASCSLIPAGSGIETLSASLAGTSTLTASNASIGFSIVTPPRSSACSGPIISASLLSGNASPPAGSSGSWTFRVEICPGQDLTDVSAQGGTNGWVTQSETQWQQSTGSITPHPKKNGETLTWDIGNMSSGTAQTLDVTVNGTVSAHCGKVQYLSGPWSALSTADGTTSKSAYTDQIAVTSTCD